MSLSGRQPIAISSRDADEYSPHCSRVVVCLFFSLRRRYFHGHLQR